MTLQLTIFCVCVCLCRENITKAIELYERAIRLSRTKMEVAQAYVAKELISDQQKACNEFGVSHSELTSRMLARQQGAL